MLSSNKSKHQTSSIPSIFIVSPDDDGLVDNNFDRNNVIENGNIEKSTTTTTTTTTTSTPRSSSSSSSSFSSSSSPFLIIPSNTKDDNHHNDNNSSSSSVPLLTEISSRRVIKRTNSGNDNDKNDDIISSSPRRYHHPSSTTLPPNPPSLNKIQNQSHQQQQQQQLKQKKQHSPYTSSPATPPLPQSQPSQPKTITTTPNTTTTTISSRLSLLFSHIRRHNLTPSNLLLTSNNNTNHQFQTLLSTNLPTSINISLAWSVIFDTLRSSSSPSSSPPMTLAIALLCFTPLSSLDSFLQHLTSDDKTTVYLAVTMLSHIPPDCQTIVVELVQCVISPLVSHLQADNNKRTVLMERVMIVISNLMSMVARRATTCRCGEEKEEAAAAEAVVVESIPHLKIMVKCLIMRDDDVEEDGSRSKKEMTSKGGSSKNRDNNNEEMTRKECRMAVLNDWIRIFESYEQMRLAEETNNMPSHRRRRRLCRHIAGAAVIFDNDETTTTTSKQRRVSSLLKNEGQCRWMGDFASLFNTRSSRSIDDSSIFIFEKEPIMIFNIFESAFQDDDGIATTNDDNDDDERDEKRSCYRQSLVRSVTLFLSQMKSQNRLLKKWSKSSSTRRRSRALSKDDNGDDYGMVVMRRVMSVLLNALQSKVLLDEDGRRGEEERGVVVNLILTCLKRLWSLFDKCFPDPIIPYNILLTALRHNQQHPLPNNNNTNSNPTITIRRSLSQLLSQILLSSPHDLLPKYIQTHCIPLNDTSLSILLQCFCQNNKDDDDDAITTTVGNHLIDNLSNGHLSNLIRQSSSSISCLFGTMERRRRFIPPLIIKYLLHSQTTTGDEVTSSSNIVSQLIIQSFSIDVSSTTSLLLSAIINSPGDTTTNRLLSIISQSWRPWLLSQRDGSYAIVLMILLNEMYKNPSLEVLLGLWGAFLCDEEEESNDDREEMAVAIVQIVTWVNKHLRCRDTTTTDVFQRLCPLLALRRVPSFYFRLLLLRRRALDYKSRECLIDLNHVLKQRLMERYGDDTSKTTISLDETRLVAELIGRCLPLNDNDNDDADNTTIKIPNDDGGTTKILPTVIGSYPTIISPLINNHHRLDRQRLGLYISCHYLPTIITIDDDNTGGGESLVAIARFALRAAVITNGEQHDNNSNNEEINKLQMGAVDFLSLCFDTWAARLLKKKERGGEGDEVMMRDVTTMLKTEKSGLYNVISLLTSTIITNRSPSSSQQNSITPSNMTIHQMTITTNDNNNNTPKQRRRQQQRICITIFNAMTIACRRCIKDHLFQLSQLLIPLVIPSSSSHFSSLSLDDDGWLVEAAAVQFILTCVARYPQSMGGVFSSNEMLRRVHRWSVEMVRGSGGKTIATTSDNVRTTRGRVVARVAGLRLLLVFVSSVVVVDPSEKDGGGGGLERFLTPGEIEEMISLLRDVATVVDGDEEVRRLVVGILGVLMR